MSGSLPERFSRSVTYLEDPRLTHNVREPLEALLADMPDVVRKAHRWVVTQEVAVEVMEHFYSLSDEDYKVAFDNFRPYDELVVQFASTVVVFVHKYSSLFDKYASDVDGDHESKDTSLCRVYMKKLPDLPNPGPDDTKYSAKTVQALALHVYVARCLATERYVEVSTLSKSERLRRRFKKTATLEFKTLSVAWDAPTVKYAAKALREEKEREAEARGPVCQHGVREFLRQMKSGKVVYVRAHTRGDPSVPRKTVTKLTSSHV